MRSIVLLAAISALAAQTPPGQPPPLQGRDLKLEARPTPPPKPGQVTVPRGFGLIIGVGKYANLNPDLHLQYSEADAESIHDVLISKEGGNFAPEDVRKFVGKEATLENIRRAIEEWLPSVARENDRVVIFFAGHGFLDEEGARVLLLRMTCNLTVLRRPPIPWTSSAGSSAARSKRNGKSCSLTRVTAAPSRQR